MWLLHLLFLLAVYTLGPGLLLVRPLRLSPTERLTCGIGIGLFFNFLLAFGIFCFGLNPAIHVVPTVISLAMGLLAWRDWRDLFRHHHVRRLLLGWVAVLVWGLLSIACIRNYAGGTWGGDWEEHYQRTRFFQGNIPYDFKFLEQYPLPMRPPMMNVLGTSLLTQAVDYVEISEQVLNGQDPGYVDFEALQVAFVFLNSLALFPCALLIGRLVKLPARHLRKATWTLAAVLAANPMFSQNLSYGWTKLFAVFYALLAVAVYLRGIGRARHEGTMARRHEREKPDDPGSVADSFLRAFVPLRLRASSTTYFPLAFALFCIGFLVHFSVGPCAFFVGLHYLIFVWWRRPNKWREASLIGSISLLVLATWFAWSIANYGVKPTFTSTSAVSDAAKMTPAENVASIARNLGNTLLPTVIRQPSIMWTEDLAQGNFAGQVRDFFFLIYQVSVTGGLGIVGLPMAAVLAWRAIRNRTQISSTIRLFWLCFFPIVYVVGVVVYGGTDRFGVAHICLQPLVYVGLCLVAGGVWTLGPYWRIVLAAGLVIDASLGVFLHLSLQHELFRMDFKKINGHDYYEVIAGPNVPSNGGQHNLKQKAEFHYRFWGDRFAEMFSLLLTVMITLLAGLMAKGLLPPRRSLANGIDLPVPVTPSKPAKKSARRRRA